MNFRRVIDILMTVTLMLLMSSNITGRFAHEYLGVSMFILFLVHQYLNRKWYGALFKGRYTLNRILSTAINITLLIAFIVTAFSGIMISENFPELNIESLTSHARTAHLSCSYLSFVLMGLHLGLHWGMIAGKIKSSWPDLISVTISGYGLYVFVSAGIFDYITLTNQFVFLDYDKNPALVILENISMLTFWTFTGYHLSRILSGKYIKPVIMCASVIIIFAMFMMYLGVQDSGF